MTFCIICIIIINANDAKKEECRMLFRLDFSNEVPIYQQIRNQIVAAIAAGTPWPRKPAST